MAEKETEYLYQHLGIVAKTLFLRLGICKCNFFFTITVLYIHILK